MHVCPCQHGTYRGRNRRALTGTAEPPEGTTTKCSSFVVKRPAGGGSNTFRWYSIGIPKWRHIPLTSPSSRAHAHRGQARSCPFPHTSAVLKPAPIPRSTKKSACIPAKGAGVRARAGPIVVVVVPEERQKARGAGAEEAGWIRGIDGANGVNGTNTAGRGSAGGSIACPKVGCSGNNGRRGSALDLPQSCNSAQQQSTRRIQHVPNDHPWKTVIFETERREAVSCDDQHLGCCGSRYKHLSYGTLGRDNEGGRRFDGVGDETTVAIAGRTSVWRLTGSPRSPRATTSAWDAMDRVATTRHTAPWAGWRRAEMDGEGR